MVQLTNFVAGEKKKVSNENKRVGGDDLFEKKKGTTPSDANFTFDGNVKGVKETVNHKWSTAAGSATDDDVDDKDTANSTRLRWGNDTFSLPAPENRSDYTALTVEKRSIMLASAIEELRATVMKKNSNVAKVVMLSQGSLSFNFRETLYEFRTLVKSSWMEASMTFNLRESWTKFKQMFSSRFFKVFAVFYMSAFNEIKVGRETQMDDILVKIGQVDHFVNNNLGNQNSGGDNEQNPASIILSTAYVALVKLVGAQYMHDGDHEELDRNMNDGTEDNFLHKLNEFVVSRLEDRDRSLNLDKIAFLGFIFTIYKPSNPNPYIRAATIIAEANCKTPLRVHMVDIAPQLSRHRQHTPTADSTYFSIIRIKFTLKCCFVIENATITATAIYSPPSRTTSKYSSKSVFAVCLVSASNLRLLPNEPPWTPQNGAGQPYNHLYSFPQQPSQIVHTSFPPSSYQLIAHHLSTT
ncbi:hypothetical protein BC829DRAFT_437148, partial [Chytridium lagenaria]